jgi:molybdopterin molybdotransferase
MQKPFLRVLSSQQARDLVKRFSHLGFEEISIESALFRVLAEPITAAEDSPRFDRSVMDGFAVRASDTFGATESSPGLFRIVGEVAMGEMAGFALSRGETARIWTGGALPESADAVVMVEHTEEVAQNSLEVFKAVAPFDNVARRGEDFGAGDALLNPGHRLRPQDLGMLAATGHTTVRAYKRPRVAVISSGDEIVPVEQIPPPGCVRDINRYTVSAMIREAHAEPVWIGIAPDDLAGLSSLVSRAMESADMVLISGGSSMGSRDHVIDVARSYGDSEILCHGVSVSPGKPLIVARVGSLPLVGLPGHPVSAMVCLEQFVVPFIRRMEGEEAAEPFLRPTCRALLARNVPSKEGRMDFVRVRLQMSGSNYVAVPVLGKSGMISSMVRADGYISIAADCEGLYKGEEVIVNLFSHWIGGTLEKEHISRHEITRGSSGDLLEASQQEKLSRI